jgi:hypothetical protein
MTDRHRCPYCGETLRVIEVHGHIQCADCHTNIMPCCGGAPLSTCHIDTSGGPGGTSGGPNEEADGHTRTGPPVP